MVIRWNRERIIRHLLEREAQGLPLTVGGQGVDNVLYSAARRIFGSWENAVHAAGIPPTRALTWERWSPAKILLIIRHLARRKRPLSAAQMERRYGNLMQTARRHFGSWTRAVLAAGVDPTRLQRVVPWTRERVMEAILTRALRNEPLVGRLVEPRSLVEAGQRFFGSWASAVSTAGLDASVTVPPPRKRKCLRREAAVPSSTASPPVPRRKWSRELVVAALRDRVREHKAISPMALDREDGALYCAARRHCGSWRNAVTAAGFDPALHRRGATDGTAGQISQQGTAAHELALQQVATGERAVPVTEGGAKKRGS